MSDNQRSGLAQMLSKKMRAKADLIWDQRRKDGGFVSDGAFDRTRANAASEAWREAAALVESWFSAQPESKAKAPPFVPQPRSSGGYTIEELSQGGKQ